MWRVYRGKYASFLTPAVLRKVPPRREGSQALLKLRANWILSVWVVAWCVVRPFPVTTIAARKKQFALIEKHAEHPLQNTTAISTPARSHLHFNTCLVCALYVPKLKVQQKIHKTKVSASFLNVFYICIARFGVVCDGPENIYGLGVICDGILLCQKCTFTCNGFTCRQDVDALGAFVLSHAIMTHSFFIPFNPWRPL